MGDTWGMKFKVVFWTSRMCTHWHTHEHTYAHNYCWSWVSAGITSVIFFLLNCSYIFFRPGNIPLLYNFSNTDFLFLHIVHTHLRVCVGLVLGWGPTLGWHLSRSTLDGFVFSRIGVCGLEVLGRKKTETQKKKTETQKRVRRASQWILNLSVFIFHILYIPQSRGGEVGKTSNKQSNYLSNTQDIL